MLIIKKITFLNTFLKESVAENCNTGHNYNYIRTMFGFVLSWVEHISYYLYVEHTVWINYYLLKQINTWLL